MRMGKYFLLGWLLSTCLFSNAQTNFRSNGTGGGPWTTNSTWQVESPNGSGTWIAASSTPTSASNTIQIRSGDNVIVSSNLTIDQTTIDVGGIVTVSSNTLTLTNTANALIVNGTLTNTGGAFSVPAQADLVINGIYTHNRNGSAIPNATWNTGSTCNVTGITGTNLTGGLTPTGGFYNFTWNCAGETKSYS